MRCAVLTGKLSLRVYLALFIVAAPLQADRSTAVGMLRSDGRVYLGAEIVTAQSAVYAGDKIRTDEGRATVKLKSGDLLVIDRNSEVALPPSSGSLVIGLGKGRMAWTASSPRGFQVDTDGLSLTPAGDVSSLAEISLASDGALVVAVERGSISVSNLRQGPVLISAGNVLTVERRLERAQGKEPGTGAQGKKSTGEKLRTFHIGKLSHAASTAVVAGGIGAAVAIPIIVANTGSSSKP